MAGILSRISRKPRKKTEPIAEVHRTLNPSNASSIETTSSLEKSPLSSSVDSDSLSMPMDTTASSPSCNIDVESPHSASHSSSNTSIAGLQNPQPHEPIMSSSQSEPSSETQGAHSGAVLGAQAGPLVVDLPAESEQTDDVDLMEITVSALGFRTRQLLSMYLNPPKLTGSDWRGLADYMDFTQLDIDNFALRENPTVEVLKNWESCGNRTIGELLRFLHDLEREDALAALEKPISIDAERWMKKNKKPDGKPLQVAEVSGTSYPNQPLCPELRGITLNDHPDGPPQLFDAYICHNSNTDYPFVMNILDIMEKPPYNLKLCTDWRDLVPGGAYTKITAELIENRCKRMIVVLSPEFLDSENCDFHIKFALSLSPGARSRRMVLVMLKPCEPPNILRFITVCDYTREALRPYFWPRLYAALNLS